MNKLKSLLFSLWNKIKT